MNIWTCRRVLLALFLATSLTACGDTGFPEFAAFSKAGVVPDDTEEPEKARPNVALLRAELGKGALTLVPPDGFCIDKRSLKQNFAVLARCDSLGGKGGAQDASLGMLLVSVAPESRRIAVDRALPATLDSDAQVLDQSMNDGVALAQVLGGAPEGVDPVYWHALAQKGGQLISLTAFAPKGGAMAQSEGARVLTALVNRIQVSDTAGEIAEATATGNKPPRGAGLRDRIGGLFNRKSFVP